MSQDNEKSKGPLTYRLALWYGYIFAAMYLLHGGINVILGFMDRNYTNLAQPIVFLVIGLLLVTPVIAFRDLKTWGWYALLGIHGVVILGALISYSHFESFVLIILSGGALYALLAPSTKEHLFGTR